MQKEVLVQQFGEKSAEDLIKLTKAYDSYIAKFKKKMNKLLEPANYEVKTGIVFSKKDTVGD